MTEVVGWSFVRPAPLAIMEHQVERGERTKKVGRSRQQAKRRIRLEAGISRSKASHPASLRTHHLLAGGWSRHPCTALPSTLASFDMLHSPTEQEFSCAFDSP